MRQHSLDDEEGACICLISSSFLRLVSFKAFYKVLYLYIFFEKDIYQPPQTMTHIWKSSVVVTKERCQNLKTTSGDDNATYPDHQQEDVEHNLENPEESVGEPLAAFGLLR